MGLQYSMFSSATPLGRLTVIVVGLAVVCLLLAAGGMRGARDGMLGRIAINYAEQWTQTLAFAVKDPRQDYESHFISGVTERRFNTAIVRGLIVHYRVYRPDGTVVFSSDQPGKALALSDDDRRTLQEVDSVSRSGLIDDDGVVVSKLDLKPLNFVIVDDEIAILNLIGAMLVNAGVKKVHKCKSAQEAQNILTDGNVSVDCVMSDHGMQPVTGLELLQKIRAGNNLGISRNLRFVMLTGHGDEEVVKTALALDVDAYVMKPISQGGLISAVERAFARKRMLKTGPDYEAIALPSL